MTELKNQLRDRWTDYLTAIDFQPLFVTVSGAHLYGFDSPDSDIDLRGCHQLPLKQIVGLIMPKETFEVETIDRETEVDLVSHEIGKYLRLLVKNNGYILEQVFSPLVIQGEKFLDELRPIAQDCVTRNHYFHYRGFFNTQLKLIEKSKPMTAKSVLYAYRVLLTGIHLMQTGKVQANLLELNREFQLEGIDDLIVSKVKEKAEFAFDWPRHKKRLLLLESQMLDAFENSDLPEKPRIAAVDELLVRVRLEGHPE